MDSIFGLASITIVVASGVSAEAGLPGIRQDSRSRVHEPFAVKVIQLLETLEPKGNGDGTSYIGESVWNERGWTFQERVLLAANLEFY